MTEVLLLRTEDIYPRTVHRTLRIFLVILPHTSYPLRHIHVLPKDELSKKFSSRRRSSVCYTGSRSYIISRTPVYPRHSSLNLRPVCDQSSDLLSCVQSRTTRLLCKEQRSLSKVMPAQRKSHDTNNRNHCYGFLCKQPGPAQ